jgi:hypothetical protein
MSKKQHQKILKKIIDLEKRLKPNKQDVTELLDYEFDENSWIKQDIEIIEEYNNLKDNMMTGMDSYNLAYQPMKIKVRKWRENY